MPSCMRAPPLAEIVMRGSFFVEARSAILTSFSPTTTPMLPPRNAKSSAAMAMS